MSSAQDVWRTPDREWKAFDAVFHFGFDAAADKTNTKCPMYLNPKDDALQDDEEDGALERQCSWRVKIAEKYKTPKHRGRWPELDVAWLNPPYGPKIMPFSKMAIRQWREFGLTVVMLASGRVETKWFRNANENARYRIELYRRLPFTEPGCKEGYIFARYDEKTCPPGREDMIGKIMFKRTVGKVNGKEVQTPIQKKSQPAFPSVVFVFTSRNDFPIYNLSDLGFVIDLQLQREKASNQLVVQTNNLLSRHERKQLENAYRD